MLERHGHRVRRARDGRPTVAGRSWCGATTAAVRRANTTTAATVGGSAARGRRASRALMDVSEPLMDGFTATSSTIRKLEHRGGGVAADVVLALTAFATADKEKCLHAGMDDYLTKPVRSDALVKAIARGGARGAAHRRRRAPPRRRVAIPAAAAGWVPRATANDFLKALPRASQQQLRVVALEAEQVRRCRPLPPPPAPAPQPPPPPPPPHHLLSHLQRAALRRSSPRSACCPRWRSCELPSRRWSHSAARPRTSTRRRGGASGVETRWPSCWRPSWATLPPTTRPAAGLPPPTAAARTRHRRRPPPLHEAPNAPAAAVAAAAAEAAAEAAAKVAAPMTPAAALTDADQRAEAAPPRAAADARDPRAPPSASPPPDAPAPAPAPAARATTPRRRRRPRRSRRSRRRLRSRRCCSAIGRAHGHDAHDPAQVQERAERLSDRTDDALFHRPPRQATARFRRG